MNTMIRKNSNLHLSFLEKSYKRIGVERLSNRQLALVRQLGCGNLDPTLVVGAIEEARLRERIEERGSQTVMNELLYCM